MIKITRTITLDGQNKSEYDSIVQHLTDTNSEAQGWKLVKEPLINRVTAVKQEEISSIQPTVG